MLTRVTDLASARQLMASLSALADQQALSLRPPPPEPTTCCGRGCNGCVWEAYFAAAEYWREESLLRLDAGSPPSSPTEIPEVRGAAGMAGPLPRAAKLPTLQDQ